MGYTTDFSEYQLEYALDPHPTGLVIWKLIHETTDHILAAGVSRSMEDMSAEVEMLFRSMP